MFKLVKIPVWAISIIIGLIGFIATVVSWGYVRDNKELTENVDFNKTEIIAVKKDLNYYAKKVDITEAITEHETKQKLEIELLNEQLNSMERTVNSINSTVNKLLDIQLKAKS